MPMTAENVRSAQQAVVDKVAAAAAEKNASDSWLNKQLHKTRLCKHFLQGRCQLGENCTFAHNRYEMQSAPDLKRTQLCKAYESGKCKDPTCTFAHGAENLCSTGAFYKKKICAWFEKGSCRNGEHCRFAHGDKEIRPEDKETESSMGSQGDYGDVADFGGIAIEDYVGIHSQGMEHTDFSMAAYTSDASVIGAKQNLFWDPTMGAEAAAWAPWAPWATQWPAMDQAEPAAEPIPFCSSPSNTMAPNFMVTNFVPAPVAPVMVAPVKTIVEEVKKVEPAQAWIKKESKSHPGRFFYFNTKTGVTSWKKPADYTEPEEMVVDQIEPEAEATAETPSCTFSVSDLLRWKAATAPWRPSDLTLIAAEVALPVEEASSPVSRPMTPPRSTQLGRKQTPERLQASETSWVAQQRARRGGGNSPSNQASLDAEVVRTVKSILNKLTIEKFPELSQQLLEIDFGCTRHVMILINELFEKATTQHHYIEMYADLCELLHTFFSENPVSDDPRCDFKRLLLSECQHSFERNLEPPADLEEMTGDQRLEAEIRYKTRMLGNIRFVGALLARHMLASKVLVAILEELITDPSPEALETVAALLTVTGPVFDKEDWAHKEELDDIFAEVQEISQKKSSTQRVKCLLQDVLDLRAAGWEDRRTIKVEGPTKLQEVADKASKIRK